MYENKTIAVIDYRADAALIGSLKKLDFHVVVTCKHEMLAEPVNGHPDMVMFREDDSRIVVCPEEYDYFTEVLQPFNIEIVKGTKTLENKYPGNISYNGALVEGRLFHKLDSTDVRILEIMDEGKVKCINVNQGYSKCSTAILGGKGIITSDMSIRNAAVREGIDVLLISSGHIGLKGYDFGFIGGATGYMDDTMYFTGSISNHPDCNRIMDFLQRKEVEAVFLSRETIYDLGTIIFLKERR